MDGKEKYLTPAGKKYLVIVMIVVLPILTVNNPYARAQAVKVSVEAVGGKIDSNSLYGGVARITTPIVGDYGAQLDLSGGEWESDSLWGVTLHGFKRDQNKMFGVIGIYSELEDVLRWQVGLEGEYYFDRFTISAAIGYQKQEDGLTPFFGDEEDAGFSTILLRWYADDNIMIETGLLRDDLNTRGLLGIEYLIKSDSVPGFALFVDGAAGNDDYHSIVGGVRYRFGESKSLMRHHREDEIVVIRK